MEMAREDENIKVPFALPECDPQITPVKSASLVIVMNFTGQAQIYTDSRIGRF
jgi:hypothetical protein